MKLSVAFFLGASLAVTLAACGALAATPLNAHDVNAMRKIGSFVAYNSPANDGSVDLVYSVTYWNETDNVKTTNLQSINYKPNTGASSAPQPLTFTYGKSDSAPVLGLGGKVIGFSSSRSGSSQLWAVAPALGSASMQQVTDFPVDIDNIKWANDANSEFITFTARVYPECSVQADVLSCTAQKDAALKARGPNIGIVYDQLYVRHWDKWVDGKVSHVFKQILKVSLSAQSLIVSTVGLPIDLMPGMNANSPVPPFGGSDQYDISADGSMIAITAETIDREIAWKTGWKIYIISLNPSNPTKPGTPQLITTFTRARCQNPAFNPSGSILAFLCMDRPGDESDKLHFVMYNTQNGAITVPSAITTFDRSVSNYKWSADGSKIVFDADSDGSHMLFSADYQGGQLVNIAPFVKRGTNNGAVQVGSGWYFMRHTFTELAGIYYIPNTVVNTPITSVTANWENPRVDALFNLSAPEYITFTSDGNRTVQGWFFKPYGWDATVSRQWPLAYLIHGGPESAWTEGWSFRWNPQLWAARGYAVFAVNPTGSVGFGQAFTDGVRGDWGGAPYRDLMTGVRYILAQNPWIDGNRACACGGSYGGYMVNWMNSQTDFFKCYVNHDGTFSVSGKYYSTDEIFFQEWEFLGPPFDPKVQSIWNKWNPANYAGTMNTPMLVIHGGLDYRVPITEGISTFTALQRRGIPSKLLYFPLENHWVLNPNNAIMWNDQVLGWLDQWTRNNPPM